MDMPDLIADASVDGRTRASTDEHAQRSWRWVWTLLFIAVTVALATSTVLSWYAESGTGTGVGADSQWANDFRASPLALVMSLTGSAVLLFAWLVFGRRAMTSTARLDRQLVAGRTVPPRAMRSHDARVMRYFAVAIPGLMLALTGDPQMATLQAVFYPSLWMLARGLRRGLIWNLITAVSVTAGLLLGAWGDSGWTGLSSSDAGDGTLPTELLRAGSIGVVSWLFSTAMGVWLTLAFTRGHEREVLLNQLRRQEAELSAERADLAAERERARMAADLHDTVSQSIAGIVMLAQQGAREQSPERSAQLFAVIESSANQALTEARSLVAATSTVGLSSATGLAPALAQVCERFARETSIDVRTDFITVDDQAMTQRRQTLLVRAAQEGLANARKHAGAGVVQVALRRASSGDAVTLTVTDDGRGLPPGFTVANSHGFGLPGLEQRIAQAGGALTLRSRQPHGTILEATL
ncbi:hypothetical protein F8O09_08750 [Pseudoclavibacter sp. CFCC 11306]|nr:hypothetical protein F8O09_08750 [Pseudoclavibacter sp. CFCC 11306]